MDNFIDNILSRNTRDRLFRFIFGSEKRKKWTLSLYNAIYNTDYTDADELTLTTINDGIYMSLKNDLSFLYADTMTLVEHQSLPTGNITIRMLFYMAQIYSNYLKDTNQIKKLYNMTKVTIPTPNFVVFYNGSRDIDEKVTFRLSDSYKVKGDIKAELVVEMFNINCGKNSTLFEKSQYLKDYSQFIAGLQKRIGSGYNRNRNEVKEAVRNAVEELSEGSELKNLLINCCEEVSGMIFDEITLQDIIEARAEEAAEMAAAEAAAKAAAEGRAEGLEAGRAEGLEAGKAEGRAEGRAEGIAEEKHKIAKAMLSKGINLNTVSQCTGIPVEELTTIL